MGKKRGGTNLTSFQSYRILLCKCPAFNNKTGDEIHIERRKYDPYTVKKRKTLYRNCQ